MVTGTQGKSILCRAGHLEKGHLVGKSGRQSLDRECNALPDADAHRA